MDGMEKIVIASDHAGREIKEDIKEIAGRRVH